MLVDKLMNDPGPLDYYDPAFRQVLEDHLNFFRNHPSTVLLTVEAARAYKYESDLFSLMAIYNVPTHFHWLVMRVNKMVMPSESTRNLTSLMIPDFGIVERIRSAHSTSRSIS
jgi:hypothetical protein